METELEMAQREIKRLQSALESMNAISRHQTNHVFSADGSEIETWFTGRLPVHPLTCGNDSNHTILFPYWDGVRVILRCRDCDYEQT